MPRFLIEQYDRYFINKMISKHVTFVFNKPLYEKLISDYVELFIRFFLEKPASDFVSEFCNIELQLTAELRQFVPDLVNDDGSCAFAEDFVYSWMKVCQVVARNKCYVFDCSMIDQQLTPIGGTKLAETHDRDRVLTFKAPEKENWVWSRRIYNDV
jgi:hypothetical protein